jgi:hypothetical protein
MSQSESFITDPDFVHAIQGKYLAVADEFICRISYSLMAP